MEKLVASLDGTTAKLLLFVLSCAAIWVLVEFRSSIKETLRDHKEDIKDVSNKFELKVSKIRSDMDKSIKDFNKGKSDFNQGVLDLRKDMSKMHLDINTDINKAKTGMVIINKNIERVGDLVTDYHQALEDENGKVVRVEKISRKNESEIGSVTRDLNDVKECYGRVKVLAEKNEKKIKETRKQVDRYGPTIEQVGQILEKAKKKA